MKAEVRRCSLQTQFCTASGCAKAAKTGLSGTENPALHDAGAVTPVQPSGMGLREVPICFKHWKQPMTTETR